MQDRKSHHRDGGWEVFAHGTDIGVRGFGETRAVAFEETAYALTSAMTDPANVRQADEIDIVCSAPNDELLLREWLNAVIGEMTKRDMLFSRFSVQIHEHGLTGRAWGEAVEEDRHTPAVAIRSATETELSVARDTEGCWVAQCVLDV